MQQWYPALISIGARSSPLQNRLGITVLAKAGENVHDLRATVGRHEGQQTLSFGRLHGILAASEAAGRYCFGEPFKRQPLA